MRQRKAQSNNKILQDDHRKLLQKEVRKLPRFNQVWEDLEPAKDGIYVKVEDVIRLIVAMTKTNNQ